jgi:hypothetical protein
VGRAGTPVEYTFDHVGEIALRDPLEGFLPLDFPPLSESGDTATMMPATSLVKHSVISTLCLVFVLLSGCSSKTTVAEGRTKPRGRILENGLPIKVDTSKLPPGDPGLQVTFIKIGGVDAGTEYEATITDSATGSFELIGTDGKGIPPGEYRIAIVLAPHGSDDLLKGRFSREKSKIHIEVKPNEDVVIDIAKYK